MQGHEFGLYIYTSMRIHVNEMRICKYELASLVRVYAKNGITIVFIDIQT